jgi:phage-related protein
LKPIEFAGDSLARLRNFPVSARRIAGYQLDRIQRGLEPDDWKPMQTIGRGVREIRIRDRAGAFRVIYLATLADRVVVLHVFQKKAQRTAKHELDLAAGRFRDLRKD